MSQVVSEDLVRRNLGKIDETKGAEWLQEHLDYVSAQSLAEPWILDTDVAVFHTVRVSPGPRENTGIRE